jgi:hypothetical protein
MFKKLAMLFKSKTDVDEQVSQEPEAESGLLGIAIGKQVIFDSADMMWLQAEMLLDNCPEELLVAAHSISIIGNGKNIDRFYASEDVYLQIAYQGRPDDGNITEITYFSYAEACTCSDSESVGDKQTLMLAPTFDYKGKTFTRVAEVDKGDNGDLLEFDEGITNSDGEMYSVFNHYALFQRELSNGTAELLAATLEDDGNGENVSFSIALGRHINSSELKVSLATTE